MYQQLKQPNLSVVGQPEMCLAYVRAVFGATGEYATAAIGWQQAQYKHVGTPPSNISVPIWFTYDGPDGHVCLWNQGTLHSTSAKGMVTFPSIQALINWMGEDFEYLGWSEDVDGERVVEPVPSPTPTPAPAPIPSGQTITLPETTGPWHLYTPGFAGNMAHVLGLIEPEVLHESLTYAILASLGNGVYRIHSQDYGVGDLWTKGSDVIIK